jgi:hypothetical protein
MCFTSTRGHFIRLQFVRRGFPTTGRTSGPSRGLPANQDPHSAQQLPALVQLHRQYLSHATGTQAPTNQCSFRPQSKVLIPSTGRQAPQGLRRMLCEFVTCHTSGTSQPIRSTCTRLGRLHFPSWVPYCSNVSKTPGNPLPSSPRNSVRPRRNTGIRSRNTCHLRGRKQFRQMLEARDFIIYNDHKTVAVADAFSAEAG